MRNLPAEPSMIYSLWQQVSVHHDEVACASAHYEEMKNLMAAEIFMSAVEDWELQRINHAADGIDDPAC